MGDVSKSTWVLQAAGLTDPALSAWTGQGLKARTSGKQTRSHTYARHLKSTGLPRDEKVRAAEGRRQGHNLLPGTLETQEQGLATGVVFVLLPKCSQAAGSASNAGSPAQKRRKSGAGEGAREERTPRAPGTAEARAGPRVSGAGLRRRGPHWYAEVPAPAVPLGTCRRAGRVPRLSLRVWQGRSPPRHRGAAPRLFRTPRRRGGAAGGRDGDRCAPRPMAGPAPLPEPPPGAPIGGRAALQVRGGARVPTTAPAASARSPEGPAH